MLRRTKEEVAKELPPKTEIIELIRLEGAQRDLYETVRSLMHAKVRDEIEKTKGYVGTGGIVNMSPTNHLGLDLSAFRMLEIKNGDWTLVPDSNS